MTPFKDSFVAMEEEVKGGKSYLCDQPVPHSEMKEIISVMQCQL